MFNIEPYSHVAFSLMRLIASKHRSSYIAVAGGRLPEDDPKTRRAIFVLDSGNDYNKLKLKELTDVAPWFEAAQENTLTGPDATVLILWDIWKIRPQVISFPSDVSTSPPRPLGPRVDTFSNLQHLDYRATLIQPFHPTRCAKWLTISWGIDDFAFTFISV